MLLLFYLFVCLWTLFEFKDMLFDTEPVVIEASIMH